MSSSATQLELLRRHDETTAAAQQQVAAVSTALQELRGEAERQKTLGACLTEHVACSMMYEVYVAYKSIYDIHIYIYMYIDDVRGI